MRHNNLISHFPFGYKTYSRGIRQKNKPGIIRVLSLDQYIQSCALIILNTNPKINTQNHFSQPLSFRRVVKDTIYDIISLVLPGARCQERIGSSLPRSQSLLVDVSRQTASSLPSDTRRERVKLPPSLLWSLTSIKSLTFVRKI